MRPERFANSDAPINLGMAIGAINLIEKGIYVAMHGNIIPIEKATRDNNTGSFIHS